MNSFNTNSQIQNKKIQVSNNNYYLLSKKNKYLLQTSLVDMYLHSNKYDAYTVTLHQEYINQPYSCFRFKIK